MLKSTRFAFMKLEQVFFFYLFFNLWLELLIIYFVIEKPLLNEGKHLNEHPKLSSINKMIVRKS